jgi:hypothetical protein
MAFMALGPHGSEKGSVKQPTVSRNSAAQGSDWILALPITRSLLVDESLLPRHATSDNVVPTRNNGFNGFFIIATSNKSWAILAMCCAYARNKAVDPTNVVFV